jgi:hypothetical protein
MSVETVLGTIGHDLKSFYSKLVVDLKLAKEAWAIITSAQTRSVLLSIGADVIALVKDAGAAAEAKGLSLALDEAVVADVAKLLADAKAGDAVLTGELKALGITV